MCFVCVLYQIYCGVQKMLVYYGGKKKITGVCPYEHGLGCQKPLYGVKGYEIMGSYFMLVE
jgi:hypothetical protein